MNKVHKPSNPEYWKTCFSVRMWLQYCCGRPYYIHEVRPWLSEIYPERKPDLNLLDIFLWRYWKTKVCASTVDNIEESWCLIQQFTSEMENSLGIFERLKVSFSRRADFCPWTLRPFRAPLVRKQKLKVINSYFVCFILIQKPLFIGNI
jgi:hypothetical protein